MRYFKKEGKVKFKKSEDSKLIEGWLKRGFTEVDKTGNPVVKNSSSKPKDKSDK